MTFRFCGAVSTTETLELGETPIHFYFNVNATCPEEAEKIANTILDNSFQGVVDYSELEAEEV